MTKKINITDLLNPATFDQHKDQLLEYFGKGGTWQHLLGYSEERMMGHYKRAYDYYQHAQFKEASDCFSYLTMINPYQYHYWMGLGMAKQNEQLYEEALVSYTAAEGIEPQNPLTHLHLSQCYHALQLSDLAIQHLQTAIELAKEKEEFDEVRKKATVILNHLRKR